MAESTAPQTPSETRPRSALVVGGGIAGLVAALDLARAGLRVTLVEANPQFGGAVGSHLIADLVLDSGADSFATRTDAVERLARDLDLGERIIRPEPLGSWVHLPEGSVPAQSTGVLGIPGDLDDPQLRGTLGRYGAWRARADLRVPARTGADAATVGQLVRARMGRAVVDRMVAPFTLGVHSAHPDQLDVDTVAPGLRRALAEHGSLSAAAASLRQAAPAGSNVAGLSGGMNTLAERLVRALNTHRVKLVPGYDVIALDRDPRRDGWMVVQRQPEFADKTAIARGELLVLATDGPTAVRLLAGQDRELGRYQPGPSPRVALASLVVDQPLLDSAPRGTGILVSPEARDVRAKALTHVSAKWDWVRQALPRGRHVLRLSYGRAGEDGAGAAPETDLTDERLVTLAMRDASVLLGVPLPARTLVDGDVVRWEQSLTRPTPGHAQRVREIRERVARLPRTVVVGAWLAGTGLANVVADTRRQVAVALGEPAPEVQRRGPAPEPETAVDDQAPQTTPGSSPSEAAPAADRPGTGTES